MRLEPREKGFSYDGIFVAHDRLRRVAVVCRIKCKHAETDRESEEIFDRRYDVEIGVRARFLQL